MDDQLQLDRQLTEFFAQAKATSLTPDEREFCRFAIESHLMAQSVSLTEAGRLDGMAHGRQTSGAPDLFLDEKEKRHVRKNIVSFMQQNPRYVPDAEVQSFSFYRIFELAFPRFALGVLMFVGVGAGVTFASQASVPGDFLYSFKVNVYEPMVSKLATSDTSQAAWEARRAQNRLKEATKLAAESKLTEEAAARLRISFEKHLEKTQENINILAANGDEEVATSIQTNLEKYLESNSSIVRQIASGGDEDPSMGIAAAARAKDSTDDKDEKEKGNSSAAHQDALVKKVQTILNAVAGSSSSDASSSVVVTSSSKAKGEDKKDGASSAASSERAVSSAKESQASSAVSAIIDVDTDEEVEVDLEANLGAQASSAAVLVPALFEDIMTATSSVPPLPNLLP